MECDYFLPNFVHENMMWIQLPGNFTLKKFTLFLHRYIRSLKLHIKLTLIISHEFHMKESTLQ